MNVMKKLRLFKADESGASMVEYGIALLVVAAVGVGLMSAIGNATGDHVAAACAVVTSTEHTSETCDTGEAGD
jgi:pilus assembly protein Flp/PilA